MPEGPSILLVKEAVAQFAGKTIIAASGNSSIDQSVLLNRTVLGFKSWGKHFLICFENLTLKVHFLMFGTYRVNERKPDKPVRLSLTFDNGELNLYTCSVKYLEGDINAHYDWSVDVMNDAWDKKKARAKLKAQREALICDVLLDQDIFAGVGNIIKNEVLYRLRIHPESVVGKIPAAKRHRLIDEARIYSFQFLEWKRLYVLKKHWLAYNQKVCLRCDLPIHRMQTGVKKRRSFVCERCQVYYGNEK